MWSSNIFWVLIFLLSKHYAAGSLVKAGVKAVQTAYTDKREHLQKEVNNVENTVSGLTCKMDAKYRRSDGNCNHMCDDGKTYMGAAGTGYARFFENSYCDGKEELSCTCSNDCLPSARAISAKIYDDKKKPDHEITANTVSFGQFCVHDMAFAQIGARISCCENGKYTSNQETHPKCAAIAVPANDPVYGPAGIECINLVRSDTTGCTPAAPVNGASHFLDLSQMYGSNLETTKSLRTCKGGKLKSKKKHGKEWLPQSLNPMETCFNLTCPEEPCYRSGDVRVNQNTMLTLMHTIWLRLHNYSARKLCGKKSACSDEKCFQETRRLLIGMYQHIVYYEYLPALLGNKHMEEYGLIYNETCRDKYGYVDDYSCDCDPSMSVECASAALRWQHSAIPELLNLYFESEDCENKTSCDADYFDVTGSIELSDWMNKPGILEKGDNSIGLSRCLFAQPQEAIDRHVARGMHSEMFNNGNDLGSDLFAMDIRRAEDHGVASLCDVAIACGILTKCQCFDDLKTCMPEKNVNILRKYYDNVKDVPLIVGGNLQRNECGAAMGSLYRCIISKQFKLLRCGDRFFFESSDSPHPFSPEELANIRGVTMASLICQHGDGIDKIQGQAFKKISEENPLQNCCDLPKLDYSLFKCHEEK